MFCRRVITLIFMWISFCPQNAFMTYEKTGARHSFSHVSYLRINQTYLTWACSYLSEPVDGVKQQSTEELPLRFWQTLHFLYCIHVCQDQRAACVQGHTHGHKLFYTASEMRAIVLWAQSTTCTSSPIRPSISSRSPWCCFSSQSLRRRKRGDRQRGEMCLSIQHTDFC